MFKRTALLATLALAASGSIAIASPDRQFDTHGFDARRLEARRFDDRRFDDRTFARHRLDDVGARHYRSSWVALSAPLRLGRMGQGAIAVNDRGTFTQLRLQTAGGVARVDRVIIMFADGSRQVARLDRLLDTRGELVEIPLDGNNRRIDRILVTGQTGRLGALEVFGI